ncbi:uncharacterized protein LOC120694344 isoform X2 [Panicum virgatum]|uniref:uncharacterized protein LOC120694344 isoform X2 n=1 Tax=Panicum virgatum TaxID=38727 RepID=UPI0019D68635|nr:uncharacterized protein LOC120694344 isoform X2 [Panicum virgatum]
MATTAPVVRHRCGESPEAGIQCAVVDSFRAQRTGGGGGNAKSAEGGCGSGAQGSRDTIAEGCGGADAEGPEASSGWGGACAGAEDFGRSGACAGAEDFERSGACGCIWCRQLLQRGHRRLLWQQWTEPHSDMGVSVFGSFNMGQNATPPGGFTNFIQPTLSKNFNFVGEQSQFAPFKPPRTLEDMPSDIPSKGNNAYVNVDSSDEAPRTEKQILWTQEDVRMISS